MCLGRGKTGIIKLLDIIEPFVLLVVFGFLKAPSPQDVSSDLTALRSIRVVLVPILPSYYKDQ